MPSSLDILIPVSIDHEDRLRNLSIVLDYLTKAKFTGVFIREYYKDKPKAKELLQQHPQFNYTAVMNDKDFFNKMVCINELFKLGTSSIACWYDVDILVNKSSLIKSIKLIKEGEYDVVYPYDGKFFDIPVEIVTKLVSDLNTPIELKECTLFNKSSWGGCAVFSRTAFIKGGGCNPNFKNVGYDDDEFLMRFRRLGFKIGRTDGVLLHLNHYRGNTSFNYNDYTKNNTDEVTKITHLPLEELKQYINNW